MRKRACISLMTIFISFFAFFSPTDAATWEAYYIIQYLGGNTVLLTEGEYEYIVELSDDCNVTSAAEDEYLAIELTGTYPSILDDVYYPSATGDQWCYVSNFPEKLFLIPFTLVYLNEDENKLIATVEESSYFMEYYSGCSSMNEFLNDTIYVNSLDASVYVLSSSGYENCDLSDFEDLADFSQFTVSKYLQNNTAVITDGTYSYITEFTSDCTLNSNSESKEIFIDSTIPDYGNNVYFEGGICEIKNFPEKLSLYQTSIENINTNNELILSFNESKYYVELSSLCTNSSMAVGSQLYLNSVDINIDINDGIYNFNNPLGYESCSMYTLKNFNEFSSFTVSKYLQNNSALITDGTYNYIVELTTNCSVSSENEGNAIYIDAMTPGYGNAVYSNNICEVSNFPDQLNLLDATIKDVQKSGKVVLAYSDKQYLVELGYGCTTDYIHTGNHIYVNSADNKIDGDDGVFNFDAPYGYESCDVYKIKKYKKDIEATSEKLHKVVALKNIKGTLKIQWKKQPGGVRYLVQVWDIDKKVKEYKTKKNTLLIKGLQKDTKFKVRVRAENKKTKGDWSKSLEIHT